MADLVGDCYWFLPAHQHVVVCNTIALHAQRVIAHLQQTYVSDIIKCEKYYHTYPAPYLVYWSMIDIATINNGEWII